MRHDAMSKTPTASQRQRWRFERLMAVAQSAYLDGQGQLATWTLQIAWMAATNRSQATNVSSGAQFMLDHPIDGIDRAILQDLADDTSMSEMVLSA
jgi:hypothetical protein